MYSVVFFSSAPIGTPFLNALVSDQRFDVRGVITMPDAPAGRGMKLQKNVIKVAAEEMNIPVFCPESLRLESKKYGPSAEKVTAWLEEVQPDFIVVIAYGKIIPQSILDIPRIAPINVHGSLLPRRRGASPIQSVFLHQEAESGITIMRMVAELDAGPMIAKKTTPLPLHWTSYELIEWMKEHGPDFLTGTLRNFGKGHLSEEDQDESKVTHCGKIEKSDGEIDPFNQSLDHIYTLWRAYSLWPKLYFNHNGKRIVISKLHVSADQYGENKNNNLFVITDNKLALNAAISEIQLKPEGKKAMSFEEFHNGYL